MASFHDFEMQSIDGAPVALSQYQDQACLVVNVASKWGLTPQYAGLRTLNDSNDGLTVLGFPCNQFGAQEPGTNEQIKEFATSKFGADFPLFAKIEVNGDGACDLYQFLKAGNPDEEGNEDIAWNFTKFLVDKSGKVVKRFGPATTTEDIQAALSEYL